MKKSPLRRAAASSCALAFSFFAHGQSNPGPLPHSQDIGNPAIPGSTHYDAMSQSYHLSAAGTNMWGERDELQFAWDRLEGDFILRARVEFIGEGVDPHRKLGWLVRSDLDDGSTYVDACIHGSGLTSMQYRAKKNGETDQVVLEDFPEGEPYPDVVQLERRGNKFIFSAAHNGETFKSVEIEDLDIPSIVYGGLFLCSHNPDVVEQAVFRDIRVVKPAPVGFRPYRDYIGSQLEILDVTNGELTAIHASSEPFEAPNWTTDGLKLIVNVSGNSPEHGVLRTFDLATRRIEQLNTGPCINNNNDHVLSHDGSMLAISNFAGERKSTVFILPVDGSDDPEQITDPAWGHSYLHGWSPDKKWIVYTAERDGQYNIFKVNVDTKTEVQLTKNEHLDDGPEYTPDGEWIYFNSTRTGLMQIWKMRPDGSDQQQVFDDEYQNWFPHISPDGKWMTVISYNADEVVANDHPYYKQVYLRLLPIDGSEKPKVIAYVYGGQGTINVPSWSPDGKKIAFVSNTQRVN